MVENQAEVGIFGGTGIYDSGLLQDSKEIIIDTPYGKTSDVITIGEFEGKKIAFMPRHGKKHYYSTTHDKLLCKHLGFQGIGNYKDYCSFCSRKLDRKK